MVNSHKRLHSLELYRISDLRFRKIEYQSNTRFYVNDTNIFEWLNQFTIWSTKCSSRADPFQELVTILEPLVDSNKVLVPLWISSKSYHKIQMENFLIPRLRSTKYTIDIHDHLQSLAFSVQLQKNFYCFLYKTPLKLKISREIFCSSHRCNAWLLYASL